MGTPTLCLDFDGVIHSYTTGWHGADVVADPPVKGAIEFIRDALKVFEVVVFSSRSHEPGGIGAMRKFFTDYGGGDLLSEIAFPVVKPSAFVTLDDRAITFEGVWPSISTLKNFKPWNKR